MLEHLHVRVTKSMRHQGETFTIDQSLQVEKIVRHWKHNNKLMSSDTVKIETIENSISANAF